MDYGLLPSDTPIPLKPSGLMGLHVHTSGEAARGETTNGTKNRPTLILRLADCQLPYRSRFGMSIEKMMNSVISKGVRGAGPQGVPLREEWGGDIVRIP